MSIKLQIPYLVRSQLQTYTDVAEGEIGGLGRIEITEDNSFLLTEVFLIEQTASAAECDLDSEGIAKLYQELLDTDKNVDDLYFWWHSHGNIGVGFSTTDRETINEWTGSWLIALVINKRKDIVAELHTWSPIHLVATLDVEDLLEHPNKEALEAEVKLKVREPVKVPLEMEKWAPKQYHQQLGWDSQYHPTPYQKPGHDNSQKEETLLKQLFPEIAEKNIYDLTDEEWETLDDIMTNMKPTDQQQIFEDLAANEDDPYEEYQREMGFFG